MVLKSNNDNSLKIYLISIKNHFHQLKIRFFEVQQPSLISSLKTFSMSNGNTTFMREFDFPIKIA